MIGFKQNHGKEITLGFKIKNFVYSTDVKSFPEESEKYLYNLDLWIVDWSDMSHIIVITFDQTLSWIEKFKQRPFLHLEHG